MTPEEQEREIVRICHEMDAARADSSLNEKQKKKRLAALHTEARAIRPPITHVGKGALGG